MVPPQVGQALARLAAFAAGFVALSPGAARAGEFDTQGEYLPAPDAAGLVSFDETPERYLAPDTDVACLPAAFTNVEANDALEGAGYVRLSVQQQCAERFLVQVPAKQSSYRATVWMRHGALHARLVALYPAESGSETAYADLFPTGRTTSDGWVELGSNELSIDGSLATAVYIRLINYADEGGVDVDALELVPSGEFEPQRACAGFADPVCDQGSRCVSQRCVPGRSHVPPLPEGELRDRVVDALRGRVRLFYGGQRSRAEFLPVALATIHKMRSAETAWAFWDGFARAVTELHDWHTSPRGGMRGAAPPRHLLNACFYEGDADLTAGAWPKHPLYKDILVSHAGPGSPLRPGDRLVAVDGMHPIAWAAGLAPLHWGHHIATDPDVFSDLAERLGGPNWGGPLIVSFAKNITVLRCDAVSQTCSSLPETMAVTELPTFGGSQVACDNRPVYQLEPGQNPNASHHVFYSFFRGRVASTTEDEAIYSLLWDTLYGGGDPNGWVNGNLRAAIDDFKANARGVILDHRAGNGGTLDAASLVTELVRPPMNIGVVRMPITFGAYDGPADAAEGQAIFEAFEHVTPYPVGSDDHDPTLPVALIIHRDGSASDYMPFGMKGAPKTRIFGPGPTAGAFSTFIEFESWGGHGFQLASGETIAFDGRALIGHGVAPDEVVLPRQSDLLQGKDTIFEAALAWVRQELKP